MSSLPTCVRFDDERFWVDFADGRTLGVPLRWYPRLLHASPEQRTRYEISRLEPGLHWDEIDENISIPALLKGYRDQSPEGRAALAAELAEAEAMQGLKHEKLAPMAAE